MRINRNARYGWLILLGVATAPIANATPFANSLWIGNDFNAGVGILNTDRAGNVLQTIANTVSIGFGVDLANGILYSNPTGGVATAYDLATLTPGVSVPLGGVTSEDLSFDGTNILAGDFGGNKINRINPADGSIVSSVAIPFSPLGLTWDGGTGFWVTPFAAGGAVTHFDATGNVLSSFVPFANSFAGGLGYDTTDGTLWIGSFGNVFHYSTAGVELGSFSTGDGRFVDGLEFEGGNVPEPATLALLGLGLAGLGFSRRKQ